MKRIELTRGLVTLVDDADYERVIAAGPWHGYPSGRNFYARHNISPGKQITLHAFLTGWPRVDHINGDGLDNRRSNLRLATHAQNIQNSRCHNRFGFKCIMRRPSGTWGAHIYIDGKWQSLGTHETAEAAARAYDAAALTHFGEFARLNFPNEVSA